MKRIISVILTIAMFLGISIETFAAYGGEKSRAYQSENCTITYSIANEWSGNQQISVSITNDGEETLRNWAIMFDNSGRIANIWNADVCKNDDKLCVIRNNGYNYEIIPNATVEFGFMLQGEDLSLPEDISLCSRTADSTESAEISYEIQNNWGDGFIAAVTVKNTSEKPLEAWKLSFNGNFDISTIWNANLLYTDDGSFKVENDITTTPIPVGGEKVFSFQGIIASGETPAISDFKLISIVIDTERTQPEPPVETEEAPSHETSEPSTGDEPDPATEETNETEEPVDPDPAERDENTILCFGEYLSEENSIKVYWYSTAEGAVSIHENTDGNGWKKLAEVTDGDFYEFTITEDFVIKYIKVSQQTADGMIESEPFIVAASEDGYACTWLDSDNDGLPDYAEKIYGTDPENADTDGDGLSDYDEIYKTGTNSLKYDTDEDGVNDADSDNDKDGLTNSEELALGTDPNSADTDGDGLSDYDEINKHNTDPLKADSDEDTLNDGDEITIGLDPNDPETFGVPDAEYKVKQTISADSEVMERVNTEDSPYELSLEITASGNAQNLIAGSSAYSVITESDARLGGAVSLDYYGGDVEKVKLTYEIGENYISNEGSEYAENCVDLQGIKRYNIFRYFEELNMLLPVATEFDEENNTLFAETDELGTYCVLDMEVLLQTFGVNPDGSQTEQVERQMYAGVNDGYNICFIIDIRKGVITDDQLDSIKKEILAFMANAMENDKRIGITICVQANSDLGEDSQSCEYVGYYTSSEELKIALDEINLVNYVGTEDKDDVDFNCLVVSDGVKMMSYQSRGTNNYIFDIYSISYSFFNRSGFAENEQAIIEKNATSTGVNISFISNERKSGSYQTEIPKATGGLMIEGFTDFGKIAYNHVFEEPLVEVEKFNAILATGYQQVELDGKLNSFNGCHSDDDNITDWVEVGGDQWIEMGLFSHDEYNNVVLPTVGQCIDALGDVPFYVEGALAESDFKGSFLNMRVMPITSDPTQEDGDGDGLSDNEDDDRLSVHKAKYKRTERFTINSRGVDRHILNMDLCSLKGDSNTEGYYRIEVYSDERLTIRFDDMPSDEYTVLSGEIDGYNDIRLYRYIYLNEGDINFSVLGEIGASYNVYITKVSAYLCGGEFGDKLDTTSDVEVYKALFDAYGVDVICYEGTSFNDIFTYKVDEYPFSCIHNEIVIVSAHGKESYILDYGLNNIYMQSGQTCENFFSQNLISIFAACYSSTGMMEGKSVIDQCVNAGARSAMGFNMAVYDEECLYFCCKVIYNILNGSCIEDSFTSADYTGLFDDKSGEANVIGVKNAFFLKEFKCIRPSNTLNDIEINFTNIYSILSYARNKKQNIVST